MASGRLATISSSRAPRSPALTRRARSHSSGAVRRRAGRRMLGAPAPSDLVLRAPDPAPLALVALIGPSLPGPGPKKRPREPAHLLICPFVILDLNPAIRPAGA